MKYYLRLFTSLLSVLLFASCASKKITDISYLQRSKAPVASFPELNVFKPNKALGSPVVIFIHGGYWDEGNKDTYGFLGRNFAKQNVVTVIPNYTLSPTGNYDSMAQEVAAAITWTHENIEKHGGNPEHIFLMGHSAGGHLIALVSTNPKYLETKGRVKGVILNDAAALDIYSQLKKNPPTSNHSFNVTWTQNEANWKDASPIRFLSSQVPPFMIYVGTKSYNSIIKQNNDFVSALNEFQPDVTIRSLDKKHIAMMTQFAFPWNKRYDEIVEFINANL